MESSLTKPVIVLGGDAAEAEPATRPLSANGFAGTFEDDESLVVLSQDQRRQRVIAMLERMAPLVAQLSQELCKERHGEYMRLAAQIEEAVIVADANLTELEAALNNGDTIQKPGRVLRLLALFSGRAAGLVRGYAAQSRLRDRHLETIRKLQAQLDELRQRPRKIHDEAVDHVKRLLLYADPRYRALNDDATRMARDLDREQGNNYYSKKADALREATARLSQQVAALDDEYRDKALQQVQDSDNGPRPT